MRPALVITDVVMPGMNGLDLIGVLRVERQGMPVIARAAHGSFDALVRSMRLGAYSQLTKPVDMAKPKAVLAGALAETAWEAAAP